ncbi:hypothetical protein [Maribellus maritimus]|uniref:hypothetical protein n=1 Tax=Maribellus maritimus TaxID=2870838 RepID=UPI001EEC3509|nr:hypothetical protein [Maribellus maritimus]MCG6191315.1 hypothetical protein [Maribellus maritimus]
MKKILSMLFLLMYFISCSTESNSVSEKPEDKNKKTVLKVVPQSFIAEIPLRVEESSGLVLYNNLLWTFNDSGGENKLFGLDSSGEIKREVAVENAMNVDWEDIAQDDKHIYIGDFGNNNGVRKNLKIYKIKKGDIDSMDTVEAVEIKFSYKEQTDFNYQPLSNSFDCEAITDFNGELIIFTKDWVNETTSVYKIPKTEGEYLLTLTDTFNVNGLVTGADISPDQKTLAMVGYKDFKPIVWVFSDITENGFFGGTEIYMELDDIFSAQTEGICFTGNDSLLISCERTATYVQQIFLIDLKTINN